MKALSRIGRIVAPLFMLVLALISAPTVYAARSGYCDGSYMGGREQCFGYFEDADGYVNGSGIFFESVIEGGLDAGGVNSLNSFISFYDAKLNSGTYYDQMGAAFVILTMLGVDGPSAGGSVGNGINLARSRFGEWETIVNGYNGAGGYGVDFYFAYSAPQGYANSARSVLTDDIVYHWKAAEVFEAVRFYTPSGTAAIIQRSCSNMIGDTNLAVPSTWTISGSTEVVGGKTTVFPGDTVYFDHYVINNGPNTADGVSYDVWQRANGGSGSQYKADTAVPLPDLTDGEKRPVVQNDPYTPTQADVGKEICRRVGVWPAVQGTNDYGDGNWACVKVLSNFDVFPKVVNGIDDVTPLMPGGSATMTGQTVNTGAAADKIATYEVQQFVVPFSAAKPVFGGVFNQTNSGARYAAASHVDKSSCTGWLTAQYGGATIKNCSQLIYVANYTYPAGTALLPPTPLPAIDADNYNPGDWVCQFISISNYRYVVNEAYANPHRVSYPICVVIAKQPSVQVWGDDVKVGNSHQVAFLNNKASVLTARFNAKNSDGVQATFGSWAEYGIFAPAPDGIISSITGGAAAGTKGNTLDLIANPSQANGLTFANANPGNYGKWAAASQVESIEQFAAMRYSEAADYATPAVNISDIAASGRVNNGDIKIVRLTHAGEVQLEGVHGSAGTVIIISNQDVRITNNISIDPTKKTVSKLGYVPQVIIIARNIIINKAVTSVDAWLVARPTDPTEPMDGANGKISTCDTIAQPPIKYTDGLTINECNVPLRINGAVVAKELQLRRTYGASRAALPNGLSTPAETINLRADAYMWARPSAGTSESLPIATMTVTELPPRF